MAERLMSIADLADYLGVPVATVYAWNSRGGGPKCLKIGRHRRYRPSDVDKWLEAPEREPARK